MRRNKKKRNDRQIKLLNPRKAHGCKFARSLSSALGSYAKADSRRIPYTYVDIDTGDLINCVSAIATGIIKPDHCAENDFLVPFSGKVHHSVEAVRILQRPGQVIYHHDGKRVHIFKIPSPSDFVHWLEKSRITALSNLRQLSENPEDYLKALFLEALTGDYRNPVELMEQDEIESMRSVMSMLLVFDLLVMHFRRRYNLPVVPTDGWERGRLLEIDFYRRRLPPCENWSPYTKKWWLEFIVAIEQNSDYGAFLGGGAEAEGDDEPSGRKKGKGRSSPKPRPDDERLAVAMAQPQFDHFRLLEKGKAIQAAKSVADPGYLGVVYHDSRREPDQQPFALEGTWTHRAMYCLRGSLSACIELASSQITRSDLAKHEMCERRIPHDTAEKWLKSLREWLEA